MLFLPASHRTCVTFLCSPPFSHHSPGKQIRPPRLTVHPNPLGTALHLSQYTEGCGLLRENIRIPGPDPSLPSQWCVDSLKLERPRPVPRCLLCLPKPPRGPGVAGTTYQPLHSINFILNSVIQNFLPAISLLNTGCRQSLPDPSQAKMNIISSVTWSQTQELVWILRGM